MISPNIFIPRNDWNVISFRCNKKQPENMVQRIRRIVTDVTGIDPYCESTYQMSEFVKARQLFFYFVRKYAKLSLYATGRLLGKDHSTVVHAEKCVIKFRDIEVNYRGSFDLIEKKIKNE